MRNWIFGIPITFVACATSHAATLSMSLADLDLPNRSAEVNVHVELVAGDDLAGVFFALEPNPQVIHASNSTTLPNWIAVNDLGTTNVPLGESQFLVAAMDAFDDALLGPGAFTVGSFVLDLPAGLTGFSLELAINVGFPFQLVKSNGQFYEFSSNPFYATYSGYFTIGTGNPGITQMMDVSPRDPLLITPEPVSLGYLALATFALIVRRRAA